MRSVLKFKFDPKIVGSMIFKRIKFFPVSPPRARFDHLVNSMSDMRLVNIHVEAATVPYYHPVLMLHLQRHLPGWTGFKAQYYEYVHQHWNSMYGDWDWSDVGQVVVVEQPLLQRDRLMQIFEACPEGSYGYYAKYGLGPFKGVVGSFAAATIDQFFASQIQFLKQPMSPAINEIMSSMETKYWNSRETWLEWIAGKTFTQGMRKLGVSLPSHLLTVWEGQRKPTLPSGEELEEVQLGIALELLREHLPELDKAVFNSWASAVFDHLVENRDIIVDDTPQTEHTIQQRD